MGDVEDTINSIKWGGMPKRRQELQDGENWTFLKQKKCFIENYHKN